MDDVKFGVLGPLQAEIDGQGVDLGAPKQRALLAALLLHPNEVVPVDRLVDELWGDRPPRTANHSVQLYVSELRKAFSAEDDNVIVTRSPGYELHVDPEVIDATRFEFMAQEGFALLGDEPEAAAAALEAALGLWRGPAFADVAYDEFAQSEIRRLDEIRLEAEDALDEARLSLGRDRDVVANAHKRVADHPMRERTRALYMRALAAVGRPADALRSFEEYRRQLGDTLGIEPGGGLRRLEEQILLQDPSLHPPAGTPATTEVRNPYKGLRPFTEADAEDFFGRARLIERLTAAVGQSRFVTVVGPSGSGKSSVIRAGLVRELLRDVEHRHAPTVMVPGAYPFAALDAAVAAAAMEQGEPVLVIDQFEELYTLVAEPTRQRFTNRLLELAADQERATRVVVAMRADFYDRPLLDAAFAETFTSTVIHVTPMSATELEAAAINPASASGLQIEPALVAEMIADVVGQPGGLPLFQFALTELADRRDDRTLTAGAYHAMGGMHGALAGIANEAMQRLDPVERDAARQLALRLVTVDDTGNAMRRRLNGAELTSLEVDTVAIRVVLERFGRHRLLTFDRDPVSEESTVELAHDALLEQWDLLADWIDTNRDDLRRRAVLSVAVAEWLNAGCDLDYLPSGAQLDTYEAWRTSTTLGLTADETAFLDAARDRAAAAAEMERSRLADERRLRRRARTRLWAIAVMAAAIVIAGIAAFTLTRPGGPRIALVYEGAGDGGFLSVLHQGWERAGRELEFQGAEVVPHVEVQEELRSLAESGYDLIISGNDFYTEAVAMVAADYPDVAFVALDDLAGVAADLPNATSVVFADDEGTYLAGAAAALTSRTGVIGFVGTTPVLYVEQLRGAFEAGARRVDPDIEVVAAYATTTMDFELGWYRPDLARAAAESLYAYGADVVLFVPRGVLDDISDLAGSTTADGIRRWAIAVDSDAYLEVPEEGRQHILTSVLKRLDVAVELTIGEFVAGDLEPGRRLLHVADGGVALSRSGGYLQPIEGELATIEEMVALGGIDFPAKGTGPMLPPSGSGEPTVTISITFDGTECRVESPDIVTGDVARLSLENQADSVVFLGVLPFESAPVSTELKVFDSESGEEFPESVVESMAVGLWLPPASASETITPPVDAPAYAVYCWDWPSLIPGRGYPAGIIEVQ